MLIVGAKGHAREILDVLEKQSFSGEICFFDDSSKNLPGKIYDSFSLLTNLEDVRQLFKTDNRFILGLGGVQNRRLLYEKFVTLGGIPYSIIAHTATIGRHNTFLGTGLNIMHQVSIFNDVSIGNGTLINSFASVHHDCKIGEFCEISPGARILGRVTIADFCSVGSNAVILPDIIIGSNVTIGAGAVVTKNCENNATFIGIPARKLK
jgi:sugar O-acyltransferase (sialic acid O-acetyltransferase NeuD family)